MTNNKNSIHGEIKAKWWKLGKVTSFKYLGAIVSDEGSKPELLSRITQATAALTKPRVGKEKKTSETDSIKFKISSKTPRGKKDSTKRHHHRHHKRQPGEQQFPIQVVTG